MDLGAIIYRGPGFSTPGFSSEKAVFLDMQVQKTLKKHIIHFFEKNSAMPSFCATERYKRSTEREMRNKNVFLIFDFFNIPYIALFPYF